MGSNSSSSLSELLPACQTQQQYNKLQLYYIEYEDMAGRCIHLVQECSAGLPSGTGLAQHGRLTGTG